LFDRLDIEMRAASGLRRLPLVELVVVVVRGDQSSPALCRDEENAGELLVSARGSHQIRWENDDPPAITREHVGPRGRASIARQAVVHF
jgi:hypothetical protein